MHFPWPYFTLRSDGRLEDEDGHLPFPFRDFDSVEEAEQFLIDTDTRGNVRPQS